MFSPLSDATNKKKSAQVIGNLIVQNENIETPATIVKRLPGARVPDIKANLKVLAKANCKLLRLLFIFEFSSLALMKYEFVSQRSHKITLKSCVKS